MSAKQIASICEGFNGLLKRVIRDLVNARPSDPQLVRIQRAMGLIADATPIQCMEKAGRHLYKYREQILSNNSSGAEFFSKHDFGCDVKVINDKNEAEMTGYALTQMKEHALTLDRQRIEEYREVLRDMLDYYLEYLEVK